MVYNLKEGTNEEIEDEDNDENEWKKTDSLPTIPS
jgi:hypothetical protein